MYFTDLPIDWAFEVRHKGIRSKLCNLSYYPWGVLYVTKLLNCTLRANLVSTLAVLHKRRINEFTLMLVKKLIVFGSERLSDGKEN